MLPYICYICEDDEADGPSSPCDTCGTNPLIMHLADKAEAAHAAGVKAGLEKAREVAATSRRHRYWDTKWAAGYRAACTDMLDALRALAAQHETEPEGE